MGTKKSKSKSKKAAFKADTRLFVAVNYTYGMDIVECQGRGELLDVLEEWNDGEEVLEGDIVVYEGTRVPVSFRRVVELAD
jgi:hypothetical protein